jgi:hypothetical protein
MGSAGEDGRAITTNDTLFTAEAQRYQRLRAEIAENGQERRERNKKRTQGETGNGELPFPSVLCVLCASAVKG